MASKSTLKIRKSLVWETKIPLNWKDSYKSSVFTFLNSKWILRISSDPNGYRTISLTLINCDGMENFLPFDVTTYLEDRRTNNIMMGSRMTVSSSCETLFKETETSIFRALPKLVQYNDITVICVFSSHLQSLLSVDEKKHKQVQANLDSPSPAKNQKQVQACLGSPSHAKSKNFETISSDTNGNNSLCSTSKFLDSSLNLKSLSEDICSLLDKKLMPDIQLKCGEQTIFAHKAILSARSKVFAATFSENTVKSQDIIEIIDIESHVFDVFLKYLYSGKFLDELSEDTILKLYVLGDKYAVQTLKMVCSKYMTENVNAENFSKFLILADMYDDKDLKESIVDFIAKSRSNKGIEEINFQRMLFRFFDRCVIL